MEYAEVAGLHVAFERCGSCAPSPTSSKRSRIRATRRPSKRVLASLSAVNGRLIDAGVDGVIAASPISWPLSQLRISGRRRRGAW